MLRKSAPNVQKAVEPWMPPSLVPPEQTDQMAGLPWFIRVPLRVLIWPFAILFDLLDWLVSKPLRRAVPPGRAIPHWLVFSYIVLATVVLTLGIRDLVNYAPPRHIGAVRCDAEAAERLEPLVSELCALPASQRASRRSYSVCNRAHDLLRDVRDGNCHGAAWNADAVRRSVDACWTDRARRRDSAEFDCRPIHLVATKMETVLSPSRASARRREGP